MADARPHLASIFLLETSPLRRMHPLSNVAGFGLTRGILATMAARLPRADLQNEGTDMNPVLGTDFVYLNREVNSVKGQHFSYNVRVGRTSENLLYSLMVLQYLNHQTVRLRYQRVTGRMRDAVAAYAEACVLQEEGSPWHIDAADREVFGSFYAGFEREYLASFARSISRLLREVMIVHGHCPQDRPDTVTLPWSHGRRLECGTLQGQSLEQWKQAWCAARDVDIAAWVNGSLEPNVLDPAEGLFPERRDHFLEAHDWMEGMSIEEQDDDEDYMDPDGNPGLAATGILWRTVGS